MFCSKCGAELNGSHKFCSGCGQPISARPKKRVPKLPIIAACVAAAAVLVVLSIVFFKIPNGGRGAGSIEKLKKIFNDGRFLSERQADCLSVQGFITVYESLESGVIITDTPDKLNSKDLSNAYAELTDEPEIGSIRLKIRKTKKYAKNSDEFIDMLNEAYDEDCLREYKDEYGTEIYEKLVSEKESIEEIYEVTSYVVEKFDGDERIVEEEDEGLYIYKINGRYYLCLYS